MIQLIAVIINELHLLWRDRSGLLVLFLMPSALVLVITLVQENVLKTVGESNIEVLYIDYDRDTVGKKIEHYLRNAGNFAVTTTDNKPSDIAAVKVGVLAGAFQAAVVVPAGLTASLNQKATAWTKSLFDKNKIPVKTDGTLLPVSSVEIYFDPTVMGSLRSVMNGAIDAILMGAEIHAQLDALSQQLPVYLKKQMQNQMAELLGDMAFEIESNSSASPPDLSLSRNRFTRVTEVSPASSGTLVRPNSVQQNVPAWALFGIFFIAVPIAGSMIKERKNGTYRRLLSFPVSPIVLLSGKMIAFMMVGAAQMGCIALIGWYVLPLFGTPVLEIGNNYGSLLIMTTAAILAAAGYGILLGTLGGSYEQVSMLGPITIVIAAAIGGIMVPVYVMPPAMKALSRVSPLAWGLNGFLDLFVRGGDAHTILPWALLLLGFCAACLVISWLFFFRRLTSSGF